MKDFYIVPTTRNYYETITAESKEEALQAFTDAMDSDMHAYFQAEENEPESDLHSYEYPDGDYETAMSIIVDTFHKKTDSDYYEESSLQYLTMENTQALVDLQKSYDSIKQLRKTIGNRRDSDEVDELFFSLLNEISGFEFDEEDEESDGMLSARLMVAEENLNEAIHILDENGINNGLDSGDRIMISPNDVDEAIKLLEMNYIEVDEI